MKHPEEKATGPVSNDKLQGKLRLYFYGRWLMLLSGVLMAAFPMVTLIREGTMPLSDLLPHLLVGALGVVLVILAAGTLRRTKQAAALIAEAGGLWRRLPVRRFWPCPGGVHCGGFCGRV